MHLFPLLTIQTSNLSIYTMGSRFYPAKHCRATTFIVFARHVRYSFSLFSKYFFLTMCQLCWRILTQIYVGMIHADESKER